MPGTGPEVWLLLRVLLALVVVLALALVSLRWLLPRLSGLSGPLGAGRRERRLRLVEMQALGRDHRMALVEVDRPTGRREVLMVLGGGSSCFLDAWPAAKTEAEAPAEAAP